MEMKLCFRFNSRLSNYLVFCQCSNYSKYVNQAKTGKSNFENDFRQNHIETSTFQKFLLGLGSGFMSIADPRRGDMVAVMGESTGAQAFKYIQSKMQESEEGRKILEDKPRISSTVVNLEKLKDMPEGTLGKAYSKFLNKYNYTPDERLAVRFVDDLELAYVAQRYREAHDLFHTILDMPTNMLGEVTVKWVEAIQTRLPMCVTGALFGPLRLAPKSTRAYSTRPTMILNSEVSGKEELKMTQHQGKSTVKRVSLPAHLEEAILSLAKENNMLYLFKEGMQKKKSLFRKLIPKEGIERENMMYSFKASVQSSLEQKAGKSEDELKAILEHRMMRYQRNLDAISTPTVFDKKNSWLYLLARSPYEYASLVKIFTEITVKDPDFAPKTIFDFGSGVGTVIWAASNVWNSSFAEYLTVDISSEMNELAYSIKELVKDKLFVKNFAQRQFFPAEEAEFDLVVSAFSLSHMTGSDERFRKINMLWKNVVKYFVIVENGTVEGFKIINEARDIILGGAAKYKSHVAAPCPHDFDCPAISGLKKRACCFLASYRELKTEKVERFDDIPYSFVVFKKGSRDPEDKQWPRIVLGPVSQKKRVTCTVCTSEGKLEEIIFSKAKHGAELYQCVKKSARGDCIQARITGNTGKCKTFVPPVAAV